MHISAVERAGLTGLADNQKVTFDIEPGRDGRESATNIELAWFSNPFEGSDSLKGVPETGRLFRFRPMRIDLTGLPAHFSDFDRFA